MQGMSVAATSATGPIIGVMARPLVSLDEVCRLFGVGLGNIIAVLSFE